MPRTMQSNRKLIWSPSAEDRKKTPAPEWGGQTLLSAWPRASVAWDPCGVGVGRQMEAPAEAKQTHESPPQPLHQGDASLFPTTENAQLAQEAAATRGSPRPEGTGPG